jgi:hypothetical protein
MRWSIVWERLNVRIKYENTVEYASSSPHHLRFSLLHMPSRNSHE